MAAKSKKNLELPDKIIELLEAERAVGPSMAKTISAAVFWYFEHLDAADREFARLECEAWLADEMSDAISQRMSAILLEKFGERDKARKKAKKSRKK